MQIIVGLGNPGKEFEHTYHNAGVLALETILAETAAQKMIMTNTEKKNAKKSVALGETYKNLFEYTTIGEMVLVRPVTYMNESGLAVRAALKKFSAPPNNLVVIHDDSDLAIGNFKISFGRNSGGHKGVQSIIDVLRTNEFSRIRIGIRPVRETTGEAQRKKAGEFALKPITPSHQKILAKVFFDIEADLPKILPLIDK